MLDSIICPFFFLWQLIVCTASALLAIGTNVSSHFPFFSLFWCSLTQPFPTPPFPTLLISTSFSWRNPTTCYLSLPSAVVYPTDPPRHCPHHASETTAAHPTFLAPISSSPAINFTKESARWGQRQQLLHFNTKLKCHHMAQSDQNEARCARVMPLLSQNMPAMMQTCHFFVGDACVGW